MDKKIHHPNKFHYKQWSPTLFLLHKSQTHKFMHRYIYPKIFNLLHSMPLYQNGITFNASYSANCIFSLYKPSFLIFYMQMADNFGQKIFDRNVVIKSLQQTVKDSLTTTNEIEECCRLTTASMEFDDRFKQEVRNSKLDFESHCDWTLYLSLDRQWRMLQSRFRIG